MESTRLRQLQQRLEELESFLQSVNQSIVLETFTTACESGRDAASACLLNQNQIEMRLRSYRNLCHHSAAYSAERVRLRKSSGQDLDAVPQWSKLAASFESLEEKFMDALNKQESLQRELHSRFHKYIVDSIESRDKLIQWLKYWQDHLSNNTHLENDPLRMGAEEYVQLCTDALKEN